MVRIFVDNTDSTAYTEALIKAVENGGALVLSNKKPVTQSQALFDRLMSPALRARVGLESTVGAGTPFVATVRHLLAAGHKIDRLVGCFSGSLGFIVTAMEQGKSFSQSVTEAARLGYLEPDPRDDLSGQDVRRKCLILARLMAQLGCDAPLELTHVDVTALLPPESDTAHECMRDPMPVLGGVGGTDGRNRFLASLGQHDAYFAQLFADAKGRGTVLRYVASIERVDRGKCATLRARVRLQDVGIEFGALQVL